MSQNATSLPSTGVQTDEQPRDCQRCGRDRPANTKRFTITVSDFTDGTADFERVLLCAECWRMLRDQLRRSVA